MASVRPPPSTKGIARKKGVSSRPPRLALVVPCFNEEQVLPETIPALSACLDDLIARGLVDKSSYMYFCDDGSSDGTWRVIADAHARLGLRLRGVKLAGNVGKDSVLYAGLVCQRDRCDIAISLDSDLQDDISQIARMVEVYSRGDVDMVFAVRSSRSVDGWFKRMCARFFYRFLRVLSGGRLIQDHADFRLMSARCLSALARYPEQHLYLRGIVPSMGFRQKIVSHDRKARVAGETKFTFGRSFGLSLDGITSQSIRPLRLVFVLGLGVLGCGLLLLCRVVWLWLWGGGVSMESLLFVSFLLLMGFQSLALGIMGEYIGKAFQEVKRRPRYLLDRELPEGEGVALKKK